MQGRSSGRGSLPGSMYRVGVCERTYPGAAVRAVEGAAVSEHPKARRV